MSQLACQFFDVDKIGIAISRARKFVRRAYKVPQRITVAVKRTAKKRTGTILHLAKCDAFVRDFSRAGRELPDPFCARPIQKGEFQPSR
jgi:hypothetical protein